MAVLVAGMLFFGVVGENFAVLLWDTVVLLVFSLANVMRILKNLHTTLRQNNKIFNIRK